MPAARCELDHQTQRAIRALRSINAIDSALFGFCIDIFKVRIFISAGLSPGLESLGFNGDHDDLRFDFRQVSELNVDFKRGQLGPPYLEDGSLAVVDLADLDSEAIPLSEAGATGQTNRLNHYREMRSIYQVAFSTHHGEIRFKFVDADLHRFVPSELDG